MRAILCPSPRIQRLAVILFTFIFFVLTGLPANAQTARYSGAVNPVGSGFSHPTAWRWTPAATSSSRITSHNAVKEIVAVGGVVTSSSHGQHGGQRIQQSLWRGGGRERQTSSSRITATAR